MAHEAEPASRKELEIATKRRLDQIASEFEEDWSDESVANMERYLSQVDEGFRGELLEHLVEVDVELRHKQKLPLNPSNYQSLGKEAVEQAKRVVAELQEDSQVGSGGDSAGKQSSPDPASLPNAFGIKEIGPYKLLQQLGEGGMGEVWMAEQTKPVRRRVAIKVIRSDIGSREAIARFEAERQALAMMDHANIAKVLDAGTTVHGRPYVVMELVMGVPITDYCDQNKLGIRERLQLFVSVCKAIQHAHQKGIIHRDIKPSNVLVTLYEGKPVAKVIDFGLAKALEGSTKLTDRTMFTEFGKVVGTLQYMSPEQAEMNALDVDTRTDVYSLGIVLYELLVGSTPLDKKSVTEKPLLETLGLIREKEAMRPSTRLGSAAEDWISGVSEQRKIAPTKLQNILRGELDWVVMKALEKDRTRRYETANDLGADISAFLNDEPVQARPPSTTYRMLKTIRKHRSLFVTTTVVMIAVIVTASVSIWSAINADRLGRQLKIQNENLTRTVDELRLSNAREIQAKEEALAAEKIAAAEKLTAEGILGFFEKDLLRSVNPWDAYKSAKQQDLLTLPVYEVLNTAARKFSVENFPQSTLTPSAYIGIMVAIADVYEGLGDLESAEKHALGAFQIARQVFGEEHPKAAETLVNLAFVYLANSESEKATTCIIRAYELAEKAMFADERTSGNKVPQSTDPQSTVPQSTDTPSPSKHAPHQRLIVKTIFDTIKQRLDYGHNSLPVWEKRSIGIANTIKLTAIALRYPRLLRRMQERFGEDDEYVGYARMIQGIALHALGQVSRAKEIYESVFRFVEQKVNSGEMPNDDIAVLGIRQLLAETYGQLEIEPLKQVEYSVQVVELMERRYGKTHPGTILAKGFCASKMVANGQSEPAVPLLQAVLQTTELHLGATHRDTVQATVQLGYALREAGKPKEALKVIEDRFHQFSNDDPESKLLLKLVPNYYALAQHSLKPDPSAAVQILQRCLEVESKHSPDHWSTFDTQSLLGEAQQLAGDLTNAKTNLEAGFQGLQQRFEKIPRKNRKGFFLESIRRLIRLARIQKDQSAETKWKAILGEAESEFKDR